MNGLTGNESNYADFFPRYFPDHVGCFRFLLHVSRVDQNNSVESQGSINLRRNNLQSWFGDFGTIPYRLTTIVEIKITDQYVSSRSSGDLHRSYPCNRSSYGVFDALIQP